VKVAHPHLFQTATYARRFAGEAAAGISVRHPNVIRTLACHVVETRSGKRLPAIVMEFVEGRTLRDLLAEMGRLPDDLCRHVGREVARGLEAIHAAGIVHRDLKPCNVMVTPAHEIKVMDFGLARVDDTERLTETGAFVGTPCYASPEQAEGRSDVDARADLYALGATLYELATGELPNRSRNSAEGARAAPPRRPVPPGRVNPQISAFLEEVILKLLSPERELRFQTAREAGAILEAGEQASWWTERATRAPDEARRPDRRVRILRETELVGREGDLAELRALYDAAKAGDGRVLLLEGEAGVGKSRLLDEFLGAVAAEGEETNELVGGFPPAGAATASSAFITAYREHFGTDGLEYALAHHLKETPVLVPAFAALLRGEPTPANAEPLTRDSLQTVFVHVTRALARERTTIVVIDDLHFAPQEGRALFAALAVAVPGTRILLVGATRPGLSPEWCVQLERSAHVRRRALERLPEDAVARLLAPTFGRGAAAERVARRVAQIAGGNPYFLVEILRTLRERGLLTTAADGSLRAAAAEIEVEIPASIRDLLVARLSALAEDDRSLLEAAACFGHEFDGRLVAEAIGRPRLDVLRRLGTLEREHRLVRAAGPRFVFDHHLIGETLLAAASPALVAETHAAIAEAIERGAKNPSGATRADLAGHFLLGGRGEDALRHLDAAMTHLEKEYRNEDAVRLAGLALAVPGLVAGRERSRLLIRQASRLHFLGRLEDECAAAEEATRLADEGGDTALSARARVVLGMAQVRASRYPQAEITLGKAKELARSAGDLVVLAMATGHLASVYQALGRFEDSEAENRRWLAHAVETGDRHAEAGATGSLAIVLTFMGRLEEALVQAERCIEVSRVLGDQLNEATATTDFGNALEALGRIDEACACFERAGAIARRIGYRVGEAIATGNLAGALMSLGRLDEALAHFGRSLELSRENRYPLGEAVALVNAASIHVEVGNAAAARDAADRAMATSLAVGNRRVEGYAIQALGLVARLEGNVAEAERRFVEAIDVRRKMGHAPGVAVSVLSLGELRMSQGREPEARAAFDEALALGRKHDLPSIEVMALARLAALPGGDPAPARAALARHEKRIHWGERIEAHHVLWETTHDRAHLAEARRLLDHLLAHAPTDCRQSMIGNVPTHRSILAAT
jgi:tetratricopeptide (TPR) repeat protein